MGWVIDAAIDWFWDGFVERRCKGKPWWVWTFWVLAPVLAVLGLLAIAVLLVAMLLR